MEEGSPVSPECTMGQLGVHYGADGTSSPHSRDQLEVDILGMSCSLVGGGALLKISDENFV